MDGSPRKRGGALARRRRLGLWTRSRPRSVCSSGCSWGWSGHPRANGGANG